MILKVADRSIHKRRMLGNHALRSPRTQHTSEGSSILKPIHGVSHSIFHIKQLYAPRSVGYT